MYEPESHLIPATKLVVPIVVGTRPEAIKLVPIIVALRESEYYEPIVVSTGQHNRMVEYIFELADIKPDVTLWAGSRRANLNERVAAVMQRFEDFCNPRVREVLTDCLSGFDNVLLTEPLGYATFARLLGRAHLVITDSGGIQEEAPSLGKPVLVTREATERTEGLEAGTLRLVGTDPRSSSPRPRGCSTARPPTRRWPRRRIPMATDTRPSGSLPRSSTCCSAADRRRPSVLATAVPRWPSPPVSSRAAGPPWNSSRRRWGGRRHHRCRSPTRSIPSCSRCRVT